MVSFSWQCKYNSASLTTPCPHVSCARLQGNRVNIANISLSNILSDNTHLDYPPRGAVTPTATRLNTEIVCTVNTCEITFTCQATRDKHLLEDHDYTVEAIALLHDDKQMSGAGRGVNTNMTKEGFSTRKIGTGQIFICQFCKTDTERRGGVFSCTKKFVMTEHITNFHLTRHRLFCRYCRGGFENEAQLESHKYSVHHQPQDFVLTSQSHLDANGVGNCGVFQRAFEPESVYTISEAFSPINVKSIITLIDRLSATTGTVSVKFSLLAMVAQISANGTQTKLHQQLLYTLKTTKFHPGGTDYTDKILEAQADLESKSEELGRIIHLNTLLLCKYSGEL